jgi:hypothetical protein
MKPFASTENLHRRRERLYTRAVWAAHTLRVMRREYDTHLERILLCSTTALHAKPDGAA